MAIAVHYKWLARKATKKSILYRKFVDMLYDHDHVLHNTEPPFSWELLNEKVKHERVWKIIQKNIYIHDILLPWG